VARIRFRSPGIKPGQKIGPLGPFRGRLGLHWVVAPLVVLVVLAVAGWLFFRGGAPEAPWQRVAPVGSLDRGSATPAGGDVWVARLPDGRVVAVAEDQGCPLSTTVAGYQDCDGALYGLDGLPEGEGDPLDLAPMQIVDGKVYVDPTRRIPRG
jgi:hypothetical protein